MIKIEEIVQLPTPLQKWENPLFERKGVAVLVKRDDLINPTWGGNKYRKLKYNLREASSNGYKGLLSFGGAYSNHLFAIAGISKLTDFKVRMIIRGDELKENSSSTLDFADKAGVELIFVSRSEYRDKASLIAQYGDDFFVIPEGGSNEFCLKGVSEMVDELLEVLMPDYVIAACGSGGTVAGILSNDSFKNDVIGVPVLKGGEFLRKEINTLIGSKLTFKLWTDYHFGGYARNNSELLAFMDKVIYETGIPLEHVYTGKLFYALYDMVENGYFESGSKIVLYHSGGLQGAIKKGLPK